MFRFNHKWKKVMSIFLFYGVVIDFSTSVCIFDGGVCDIWGRRNIFAYFFIIAATNDLVAKMNIALNKSPFLNNSKICSMIKEIYKNEIFKEFNLHLNTNT